MVRTVKRIGGDTAQVVEEFAVDTGLLRELREIEKQAALECGQWVEKTEPTHEGMTATVPAGRPDLRAMGPARLQVLINLFRDAERKCLIVSGPVGRCGQSVIAAVDSVASGISE